MQRAAARFINVDLLKFRSSAAWFRIGDCPTDALGRRSRIVVLDGVVEGGQQVFPAGPARITVSMGGGLVGKEACGCL